MLSRAFAILGAIAEAGEPLSPKEIARRTGLNPATVARILSGLGSFGFVRKSDYRHYVPGFGLLPFACEAIANSPLLLRSLPVMRGLRKETGMVVALGAFWQRDLVYLARIEPTGEWIASGYRYPVHLSSIAMRLLIEMPVKEALACLEHSRSQSGWLQPNELAPSNPMEALAAAQRQLADDILVLHNSDDPDHVSAAIPIREQGRPIAALAVTGSERRAGGDRIVTLLEEASRAIDTGHGVANVGPSPSGSAGTRRKAVPAG